jgi:hypothetical protein
MDTYKTPISVGYLRQQLSKIEAALNDSTMPALKAVCIVEELRNAIDRVNPANGKGDITYRLATQLEESNRCLLALTHKQEQIKIATVLQNNSEALTLYYGDK